MLIEDKQNHTRYKTRRYRYYKQGPLAATGCGGRRCVSRVSPIAPVPINGTRRSLHFHRPHMSSAIIYSSTSSIHRTFIDSRADRGARGPVGSLLVFFVLYWLFFFPLQLFLFTGFSCRGRSWRVSLRPANENRGRENMTDRKNITIRWSITSGWADPLETVWFGRHYTVGRTNYENTERREKNFYAVSHPSESIGVQWFPSKKLVKKLHVDAISCRSFERGAPKELLSFLSKWIYLD